VVGAYAYTLPPTAAPPIWGQRTSSYGDFCPSEGLNVDQASFGGTALSSACRTVPRCTPCLSASARMGVVHPAGLNEFYNTTMVKSFKELLVPFSSLLR